MYEKLRGIVLNTVRYSDKHNIVHIYTDGHGLMSFAVPLGKTNAARMRNAMLMPLSLVDLEAGVRSSHEVSRLRELRRNYPLATIYSDPVKNAIALFISELLAHVIQEPEGNGPLFRYIEQSVQLLEQMPGQVANFHICFLYHLGAHLGHGEPPPDVLSGSHKPDYTRRGIYPDRVHPERWKACNPQRHCSAPRSRVRRP